MHPTIELLEALAAIYLRLPYVMAGILTGTLTADDQRSYGEDLVAIGTELNS